MSIEVDSETVRAGGHELRAAGVGVATDRGVFADGREREINPLGRHTVAAGLPWWRYCTLTKCIIEIPHSFRGTSGALWVARTIANGPREAVAGGQSA